MDNCGSLSSYLYLLTILVLTTTTFAYYRDNFGAYEEVKCIPKIDFFKTISCRLDKKTGTISAYAEMKEQVDSLLLDISANMSQKNIPTKEIFNSKKIKVCEIVKEPVLNPVLKLIKMAVGKYLNMPDKCPIPANYVFKLSNLTLNAEILPVYLPDCTFKSRGIVSSKHIAILTVELTGRIAHRKPNAKGRKTWKTS